MFLRLSLTAPSEWAFLTAASFCCRASSEQRRRLQLPDEVPFFVHCMPDAFQNRSQLPALAAQVLNVPGLGLRLVVGSLGFIREGFGTLSNLTELLDISSAIMFMCLRTAISANESSDGLSTALSARTVPPSLRMLSSQFSTNLFILLGSVGG